ncbi:hypothetical protein EG850_11125 [Gulosibacter macacae]|uniref:Uncharacterized protein n=1 Tax=Gulosibacter macacae TaxID=2488791 RepID=A0A3P3VTE9_9MICO|nr:hypothetical protein [Gulosibacter macacae]RRJ85930.1 hypothetical protein EG850_11125 [Gulosibacter macacae]
MTGLGLHLFADDHGRAEARPALIRAALYPEDESVTTSLVEEHLLELDDVGFLRLYTSEGRDLLQLLHPTRVDRPTKSRIPEPPRERSRGFAAVGSGRVLRERVEASAEWAEWEAAQERGAAPPVRPLLLDAPPIGCPDHPNGRFADCGPCGTARRRHSAWLATARYSQQVDEYERSRRVTDEQADYYDEEPF